MKCDHPVPVNKKLYNSIKKQIKTKSKVWPSAYASGRLVRTYKSKGGKYRCSFGSLDRWFKEKWVNVCKNNSPCGRTKSSWKRYPYCRPSVRVNKNTPKTAGEIGKAKLRKMCKLKRKNPRKKVNLNNFGENKNDSNNKMEKGYCGFGNRRCSRVGKCRQCSQFGNNIGPTNSNLDSFYENGTADSSHLTDRIRKCESGFYDDSVLYTSRFGKKNNNFIKLANERSKKKGTVGSFTRWCKKRGYPHVTTKCINEGKKSKSLKTRRRAIFAQNIRRKYSFGNDEESLKHRKELYNKMSLRELQDELEEAQNRAHDLRSRPRNRQHDSNFAKKVVELIENIIKKKTIPNLRKREVTGKFNFGEMRNLNKEINYLKLKN